MDTYTTISQYIESKTDTLARIQAYESLISTMELKLIDSTSNSDIINFSMDDGQMKVQTTYRGVESMQKAINALIKAKNRLVNNYNGNITILRGGNLCGY